LGILVLLAFVVGATACGRERLLPRPDPLPIHAWGELTAGEQKRLRDLARDPRLPAGEVEAALKRALAGFGSAGSFCDRLQRELRALALSGPLAEQPARIAFAVSIGTAHAQWLSTSGARRYPDPRALARAIRDGELEPGSFAPDTPLGKAERPFFVTDAAEFDGPGPSAARRLCLSGPPAASYVLALIPSADLPAPLRVPTAADAVCRPNFELPPPDARTGRTCGGSVEFVTAPPTMGSVSEFRLTR
jgi:hypothetical protein